MASEIKMPQLSDTMNSGKILSWRKKEGDPIQRGEILAEVETDKANLEIECFQPGTLLKILVAAGGTAKVGEAIAVIGSADEKIAEPCKSVTDAVELKEPLDSKLHDAAKESPPLEKKPSEAEQGRVKASPLARKLAEQNQVDLRAIQGSGPGGRIIAKDLELAKKLTTPKEVETASFFDTPAGLSGRLFPMSKMRQTIAQRMLQSVTHAPHFYMNSTIDMEQAIRLKEVLKQRPEYKELTVNHLVIKATAYAISREPRVNRTLRDGQIFGPDQINIGVITAIEEGLMIPVIKQADRLPLKDLVTEANAMIKRVREGRPTSADLLGGTFTISNMGMFNVENFSAIINPGQGAILAVGAIQKEPCVRNGQIVIGSLMKVTASFDHRLNDAVIGANFLKFLKEGLENPGLLLE